MTSHYANKKIEWTKNNTFKEENDEKIGYTLVVDGYFFKFNRKNKNSINYLCKNRKDGCSASCSIDKETMNKMWSKNVISRRYK